jgi:hypothetical protein
MAELFVRVFDQEKIDIRWKACDIVGDNVGMGFLDPIPVGAFYPGELDILEEWGGDGEMAAKKNLAGMKKFCFLFRIQAHTGGFHSYGQAGGSEDNGNLFNMMSDFSREAQAKCSRQYFYPSLKGLCAATL